MQKLPRFLLILLMVSTSARLAMSQTILETNSVDNAAELLIRRFSSDGPEAYDALGMTPGQFIKFLESITTHSHEFLETLLGACRRPDKNCTWKNECPGVGEIFTSLAPDGFLAVDGFVDALPLALNTITSENCTRGATEETYHASGKKRPSKAEAWGCGIGFVSLIILISNIGVFLGPIMEKTFFKRLLQFLVATGAGSLASTSLLVLIPEAFGVMAVEEMRHVYVWKSSVVIISIYALFSLERMFKTFLYNRKQKKTDCSASTDNGEDSTVPLTEGKVNPRMNGAVENGHSHFDLSAEQTNDKVALAWMVMAGDVIHNFVDGLSIGAAFTEDLTLGVSVSLAVICEELPHELADIAILLHSGLSIKKSLLINFLSACVCYIGLVIGVLLGSNIAEASKWIFAIAGGLFLYVPLVDMLPDMSNHLDTLLHRGGNEAKIVAFLHTLGLLTGALLIIFIVNVNSYMLV
ncbi:unnamed protein product [Lymnaea stagnalis]|uniref:Uncharacterized protein n=1 Tax=Lymnaea stagnalis TaxID=6523 RepID=A0AAV2I9L8_LYMST